MGDTFEGELYLIDRQSGERRLLTAGHSGHAHARATERIIWY